MGKHVHGAAMQPPNKNFRTNGRSQTAQKQPLSVEKIRETVASQSDEQGNALATLERAIRTGCPDALRDAWLGFKYVYESEMWLMQNLV